MDVIFNIINEDARHVSNFVILLDKQYLNRTRCLEQQISMYSFKQEVECIHNTEKYIVIKKPRNYLNMS